MVPGVKKLAECVKSDDFHERKLSKIHISACAYSRISSGTKVDQLEELYKISWKTPMLTHITLVNTVRVYRVTFLVKNNFKRSLVIFILFSYSRSTK